MKKAKADGVRVWLVWQHRPYEGTALCSLHGTEKGARKARKKRKRLRTDLMRVDGTKLYIEERTLEDLK